MATRNKRFGRVRRELRFYRAVLQDPRTPRAARWLIGAGLAYLCTPFDLIPDFIPLIGQLDDLLVVPALIGTAMVLTPATVKLDAERRTRRIRARIAPPNADVLFEAEALPGSFGIRANGVDLNVADINETLLALRGLLLEHRVVVVSQQISRAEILERYSRAFGQPVFQRRHDERKPARMTYSANVLSIFNAVPRPNGPRRCSDQPPQSVAATLMILCSLEPSNPVTERTFVDMMAAYEALPEDYRRAVDNLQVSSSPEMVYPLVRVHPVTGRKSLSPVLDDRHAIVGVPDKDSVDLLGRLRSHVLQPEFRCLYRFQVGDLLAWDPLATTPWGSSEDKSVDGGLIHLR